MTQHLPVIRRDPDTGQDVIVPMPADAELRRAKNLDRRIRLLVSSIHNSIEKLHQLVEQARETESYKLLGYATMADYVAAVFVIPNRLDRGTRAEVVGFLSDHVGMSQRQIGAVVQADHKTVGNDLRERRVGENSPPVAGATAPSQDVVDAVSDRDEQPARRRQGPLPDEARKLSLDLGKIVKRAKKMLDDDRFERNRDIIGCTIRPQIEFGMDVLQRFDAEINPPEPASPDGALKAMVDTLQSVLVGALVQPTHGVDQNYVIQYVDAMKDLLDAIGDAVNQWTVQR